MTIANNPASRLYAVLSQVFTDEAAVRQSDDTIGQRLQGALGVQDNVSVLEQLSTLRSLIQAVALAIDDEGLARDAWLEPWAGPVRTLLATIVNEGLQVPMKNLHANNQYLPVHTLSSLRACGQYFDKHGQTVPLSDDELAEIRLMVADLREAVLKAEHVSPHLRAVLLDYLRDMEDALTRVRLIGPEGLTDALNQGFGIWAQAVQHAHSNAAADDAETLTRWQTFILKVAQYTGWGRRVAGAAGVTGADAVKAMEGVRKAIEAAPPL